ncbi:hypothetical protein AB4341_18795 [Vibrio breoganii]
MKKLFLHIGSHKTGTTSIQKSLSIYSDKLDKAGLFFLPGNSANLFRDKSKGFDEIFCGYGAVIDKDFIRNNLSKIEFREKNIISSEFFSWLFDINEITKLKEVLSEIFDEVTVISYIRRQDYQLISHTQQSSKSLSIFNGLYYSGGSLSIPNRLDNYDGYLDYNKRLGNWAAVFGHKNILIKVFDRSAMKNGDIVEDFYGIFNISALPIPPVNESNGFERTKIGHLLNQSKLKGTLRQIILYGADNSGKQLPSRNQAREVYARYRYSNTELNRKFNISKNYESIFDDDFSMYPDKSKDIWTEDSANQAFINLFNALSDIDVNVDFLRDCAVALEKVDLNKSYKLMSMAHKARPCGHFIKRKLKEYEKTLSDRSKLSVVSKRFDLP